MIRIALVGHGTGAADDATARRFARLLARAAGPRPVSLLRASLPGPAGRTPDGTAPPSWERLEEEAPLDAAIVLGTEPAAASPRDEPCWPALRALFRWSERHGRPMLMSCLAAHAALHHADGVPRVRLARKRFGVHSCRAEPGDPLVANVAERFPVPHSRWHTVRERDLDPACCRVLTRAPDGDIDSCVRRGPATWLLLQGHPEYGGRTLAAQYRRDVARFLDGAASAYPELPAGVFGAGATARLERFRRAACAGAVSITAFPARVDAAAPEPWTAPMAALIGNWLDACAGPADAARGAAGAGRAFGRAVEPPPAAAPP